MICREFSGIKNAALFVSFVILHKEYDYSQFSWLLYICPIDECERYPQRLGYVHFEK